ncbi:hypothetical protein HMI54_009339 [Coelomomyces lativittatus]|nr:hypothetical protein HMI56_005572 [Coelomomyces lativittatus]KAJ1515414.1 hypothetical protein HMI55_003720 [Coelomomyces lativittatus]KAJ1516468.1 hypothetical protein HMI54_009339 [Coelomomyces lativittatus]
METALVDPLLYQRSKFSSFLKFIFSIVATIFMVQMNFLLFFYRKAVFATPDLFLYYVLTFECAVSSSIRIAIYFYDSAPIEKLQIYGDLPCLMKDLSYNVSMLHGVLLLITISLYRYLKIVKRKKYPLRFWCCLVAGIWIYCILVGIVLPVVGYFSELNPNNIPHRCIWHEQPDAIFLHDEPMNKIEIGFIFTTLVTGVISVFLCYFRIILVLRSNTKRLSHSETLFTKNGTKVNLAEVRQNSKHFTSNPSIHEGIVSVQSGITSIKSFKKVPSGLPIMPPLAGQSTIATFNHHQTQKNPPRRSTGEFNRKIEASATIRAIIITAVHSFFWSPYILINYYIIMQIEPPKTLLNTTSYFVIGEPIVVGALKLFIEPNLAALLKKLISNISRLSKKMKSKIKQFLNW